MTDALRLRIAVFGIGEAGSVIAADLAAAGAEVAAFDPADVPTPDGIERVESPGEAVKGRKLVMAVTAAADAQAAIAQAWNVLPRGAIYADLSTAPPTLKEDLNDTATLRGLVFVDVALMATVPGRGISTPALASGSGAAEFATLFNGLGGAVEVVGDEPGLAATRKLLRSVVTKGFTALVLEAMAGAENLDLRDWMWEHIVEFLEAADRASLDRLVEGTEAHVDRRIVEMDSASAMLESVDVEPVMTRAVESLLKRVRDGTMGLPEV